MKLYLSETQSVASVINQLTRIPERDVQLVFPEHTNFFTDPENLQLLKNQGLLLSKKITIICSDAHAVQMAHAAGLTTGDSPEQEIEQDFLASKDSTKGEEFTKRYFDLDKRSTESIEPIELPSDETMIQIKQGAESLPEDRSRLSDPLAQEEDARALFDKAALPEEERVPIEEGLKEAVKKDSRNLMIKLAVGGVFIGILVFLYFYLPKATLELFALRERLSFSIEVTATKAATGVDVEKRVIPAQSIEIAKDLSSPFEVKKKGSSTAKAKGMITVHNDLGTPQTMIPSRFQSENNNIYWSQRNIQIPAKGTLEIEVVADKPGSAYNLTCSAKSPCNFTIPAWKGTDNYKKIYGTGTTSLSGGASGQGFIVGEEEFQQAQVALRTELLAQAQKDLATKIPEGYMLLEDSIRSEVIDVASNPAVDAISQDGKATITGKVILQAFAIKDSDMRDLINALVKSQLPSDREEKPESIKAEYKVISTDFNGGKLAINVNTSEETAYKIDSDELKKQLAGKSETEVRKFLKDLPKVQSAKITLWPFWVRAIPERLERIDIDIQ